MYTYCSSVTELCSTLWPHGPQHTRLPCPSLSPRVWSNSCPLSQWSYLTILSSDAPFSPCLQSFPSSGSFSSGFIVLHCRHILYKCICVCSFALQFIKVLSHAAVCHSSIRWLGAGYPLHILLYICCCSVTWLCLTLCNPLNCSMPGCSLFYCLPEFGQTHVHWVSEAI